MKFSGNFLVLSVALIMCACSQSDGAKATDSPVDSPLASASDPSSEPEFVEISDQKRLQSEDEIKSWCKKDRSHDPDSCYCDTERPSWLAQDVENKGHRAKLDVIRADDGTIKFVIVNDYFMPNDGSAYSGFSNTHIYFPNIEACKADART